MADNVAITAGSGTTINTDDCGAAGHAQGVKLLYSADGVATPVTADANGLEVQVSNASIAGTAGSPGSSVLSVQGIASMTPVQVTPVGTITPKAFNDTSSRAAGSATVALASTTGKKLRIYGVVFSAYGTTAGRVIFYLGNADTTYTAGTNVPVFIGSFAPSATVKPGAVLMFPVPILSATDDDVYYQNDAAISVDMMFLYDEV